MSSCEDLERWAPARRDRDGAYAARRAQRAIFGHDERVGRCGLRMMGGVSLDWVAGAKVLASWPAESCFWSGCAMCGRSIRARRAAELVVAASRWESGDRWDAAACEVAAGVTEPGWLMMLTLAPPHHPGDDLADTLAKLEEVWRVVRSDKPGATWRKRWAIKHTYSVLECTVGGVRGDHPHRHVLLFGQGDMPDPGEVGDSLLTLLWARAMRVGGAALEVMAGWSSAGVDCREAGTSAASYIAKVAGQDAVLEAERRALGGVGAEMTDAQSRKEGRGNAGGVSTLAVCRIIAGEHAAAGGQRISRAWIDAQPSTAPLAQALREWRRLTFARPLMLPSKRLRAELVPEMAGLTDEEVVSQAQALREEDHAAVAKALGSGEDDDDDDEDGFDRRNLDVAEPVWKSWEANCAAMSDAPWGGPEAEACRLVERVGARDAAGVFAAIYARLAREGPPAVRAHVSGYRVRVAPADDSEWDDEMWLVMP